jgi:hypothetical protein
LCYEFCLWLLVTCIFAKQLGSLHSSWKYFPNSCCTWLLLLHVLQFPAFFCPLLIVWCRFTHQLVHPLGLYGAYCLRIIAGVGELFQYIFLDPNNIWKTWGRRVGSFLGRQRIELRTGDQLCPRDCSGHSLQTLETSPHHRLPSGSTCELPSELRDFLSLSLGLTDPFTVNGAGCPTQTKERKSPQGGREKKCHLSWLSSRQLRWLNWVLLYLILDKEDFWVHFLLKCSC